MIKVYSHSTPNLVMIWFSYLTDVAYLEKGRGTLVNVIIIK